MQPHLLLTGATGFVGQYLLRDLLRRGVPVAALVRPRGAESAPERLTPDDPPLPAPVCLTGDVTASGLGLSPDDRGWVARHCDSVLHAAASLDFLGQDRAGEPWRTNVAGTENLLRFCRQTGLRDFHHISTAYVCGLRQDVVHETDLDQGQLFKNDYERSKLEAEKVVRSASFLRSVTVYRPAVVIGDSQTGHTASYHGLYVYLHFVSVLRKHAQPGADGRWQLPVRLTLTGEEKRNLVPVDWVSAATVQLVLDPRQHGRTYHLTPAHPIRVREIEAAVADYFDYIGPEFVGPGGLPADTLNEVEKRFYQHVALYQPYWSGEPVFDSTNTQTALPALPCPVVDQPMIHRMIDYAVHDRWGRRAR
jgi:thioester reductase-like protein